MLEPRKARDAPVPGSAQAVSRLVLRSLAERLDHTRERLALTAVQPAPCPDQSSGSRMVSAVLTEQFRRLALERVRQPDQFGRRDPVHALLIFLELLEGDVDRCSADAIGPRSFSRTARRALGSIGSGSAAEPVARSATIRAQIGVWRAFSAVTLELEADPAIGTQCLSPPASSKKKR